jgi:diguanylate cyclase (GGDEF)-like protein
MNNALKKALIWIFLGHAPKDISSMDDVLRVATLNLIAVLGTPYILIFFAHIYLTGNGDLFQLTAAYVTALIFIVAFIILHTVEGIKCFNYVKIVVILAVLFLYAMIYAVVWHGDKWVFLIPLMAIFVMKIKWGLILCLVYFISMVVSEFYFRETNLAQFSRYACIFWAQAALICAYDMLINIYNERLLKDKKKIEFLSVNDNLTGLYNRSYFSELMEREFDRAMRQNKYLSFLMVDADKFKNYNETYGHLQGDELLISISRLLKNVSRRFGDLVFRMGDEEFGVLLPDADSKEAFWVAEKIRADVSKITGTTVSIGIASVLPKLGDNAGDLLKTVDDNLYKAKKTGRNRVVYQ